jgi:hypothetical protein
MKTKHFVIAGIVIALIVVVFLVINSGVDLAKLFPDEPINPGH